MSANLGFRDMTAYLNTQRDRIYDLYAVQGLRIDEIHRELVWFQRPWVSEGRLRTAIRRWKSIGQPGQWPERPTRTVGNGPIPASHVPYAHTSMPAMLSSHQDYSNRATHHSSPANMMPASMIGVGMAMASSNNPSQSTKNITSEIPLHDVPSSWGNFREPQHLSRYYHDGQVLSTGNMNIAGNSWQRSPNEQISNPVNSNTTYVTQVHATFQNFPQEIADNESDDEFEDEPEVGNECNYCGKIVGQSCSCDPLFG